MYDFRTNQAYVKYSLGTLNSGEILIAQISKNVGVKENEPSFIYIFNAWR